MASLKAFVRFAVAVENTSLAERLAVCVKPLPNGGQAFEPARAVPRSVKTLNCGRNRDNMSFMVISSPT